MKLLTFSLSLLVLARVWASYDSDITSFEYELCDENIIQNLTLARKRHGNRNVVNGSLVFVQNVDALELEFGVILLRKVGPNIVMMNITAGICDILQNQNSIRSSLLRVILGKFRQTKGYFPHKCPIEVNRPIVIENFYLDASSFPAYMPEVTYMAKFHLTLHQKYIVKSFLNGTVSKKRKNS